MVQHIIILTETEDMALSYAAFSQQDWIQNAAKARASAAIDEIVQITVKQCLEENIQIPGSKEAMVALAFEKGWTKPASQNIDIVQPPYTE